MGAIATARAYMHTVLDGNVTLDGYAVAVRDKLEAWQPPCLVVSPAEPFIRPQGPNGRGEFRFDVTILADPSKPDKAVTTVDALLEDLLGVLDGSDYTLLDQVSYPDAIEINGQQYPAAVVTVTLPVTLYT